MTHTYILQDRTIYCDGKAFATLSRAQHNEHGTVNGYAFPPHELDAFARAIPDIINAARDLAEQVDNYANSDEADIPSADRLCLALSKIGV